MSQTRPAEPTQAGAPTATEDETPRLTPSSTSVAKGLVRTARPKQWVKNVLVFAAPAAAGALFQAEIAAESALTFLVFTLASIGTYFANDAADHEADRRHPTKNRRPVASGVISVPLAWAIAGVAIATSLALSAGLNGPKLTALIAGYVTLTLSYSLFLKHIPIVDLACVAAGFVLRMIAGALATDIPISNWFLTVASFSSLLVVAGKRYAEVLELGEGVSHSRAVLAQYTAPFLRSVWGMAMAVAVAAYCQWAFERADAVGSHVWYQLSAVPWVMSLLRYGLLLEKGHGGAPEDVLASDRLMQVLGLLWLVLFGLGVYDN